MQKCADCGRALSLKDGSCYYCRETPGSSEAEVKMILIDMAREQEESATSDSIFKLAKFISGVCGILFMAASLSDYFYTKTFFLVCALMFWANAWILDRIFTRSVAFCFLVSGISAVYILSVGVGFLRGESRDFTLAVSSVLLAIIAALPALLMIYNLEKERRKK